MEEALLLWDKAGSCNVKYDVDEVHEGLEGQYMLLSDVNSQEAVKLEYNGLALFHQEVYESAWLDDLRSHFERYGGGLITSHTFFEVMESSLSREIARMSGGSLSEGDLLHLRLIAGNYIADIVFAGEPALVPVAESANVEIPRKEGQ